jgi:hypothetical protein
MSYTPTEWKTGDVITADKLNNMESGIADAGSGGSGSGDVLVVTVTESDGDYSCDKTFAEMSSCLNSGGILVFKVVLEPLEYYLYANNRDTIDGNISAYGVDVSQNPTPEEEDILYVNKSNITVYQDGSVDYEYNSYTVKVEI